MEQFGAIFLDEFGEKDEDTEQTIATCETMEPIKKTFIQKNSALR